MEIVKTIKIKLEDKEKSALQTLKDAYIQCVIDDLFDCDNCPLYHGDGCIGMYADEILNKQDRG